MNIIIFGLPGSGKTFFAARLAAMINANHINSDAVRKDLQKMGCYDKQSKNDVYYTMLSLMEDCIREHKDAVLDATFSTESIRSLFIATALAFHEPLYFIEVRAAEAIIKSRVAVKREDSEADFKVYLKLKFEFEPLLQDHLVLYSDKDPVDEMLQRALTYINYHEYG